MAKRRRGGQELPDEVQDRPEQNAGYDEAVKSGEPLDTVSAADIESVEPDATDQELSLVDDDIHAPDDVDEAAARDAAREVRRRERASR